jgi:hypothetical protein
MNKTGHLTMEQRDKNMELRSKQTSTPIILEAPAGTGYNPADMREESEGRTLYLGIARDPFCSMQCSIHESRPLHPVALEWEPLRHTKSSHLHTDLAQQLASSFLATMPAATSQHRSSSYNIATAVVAAGLRRNAVFQSCAVVIPRNMPQSDP